MTNIKIKKQGFTLIEILIVIAIIGIIAAVVLVSLSTAKDNAKQKAVYSQMSAMQAEASGCLISNLQNIMCNTGASLVNCRGNANTNSIPNEGQPICSSSSQTWSTISDKGYVYGGRACSITGSGFFSFQAYKNIASPDVIYCCTHTGCREINVQAYGNVDVNGDPAATNLDDTLLQCKNVVAGLASEWGASGCATN